MMNLFFKHLFCKFMTLAKTGAHRPEEKRILCVYKAAYAHQSQRRCNL